MNDPTDARCWLFLLGPRRRATLKRYAARLVAFLDPLVLPAFTASIDSWGDVAEDEQWRNQPEARAQLYAQGLLWRDLFRGERRPEDLDRVSIGDLVQEVQPSASCGPYSGRGSFLGLLGAAVLVLGVIGLAAGFNDRAIATAFAVLGALGITVTGAYPRAKANAASVLSTVRDAIERERSSGPRPQST